MKRRLLFAGFFLIFAFQNCGPGFQTLDQSSLVFYDDQLSLASVPLIEFTEKPELLSSSESVKFKFRTSEPGRKTFCQLDSSAEVDCSTGIFEINSIAEGEHILRIRIESSSNPESASLLHRFIIDRTPPVLEFILTPDTISSNPNGKFALKAEDAQGVNFKYFYTLNGGTEIESDSASLEFKSLPEGSNSVSFRVQDQAKNFSGFKVFNWTTDYKEVPVSITQAPLPLTNNLTATVVFQLSRAVTNVSFQCSLNNSDFLNCMSPLQITQGLLQGENSIKIRTINGAGVVSAAAESKWIVDSQPPLINLVAPSLETEASSIVFNWTVSDNLALKNVDCIFNGTKVSGCLTTRSWSLRAGENTFELQAQDTAGNESKSSLIKIYRKCLAGLKQIGSSCVTPFENNTFTSECSYENPNFYFRAINEFKPDGQLIFTVLRYSGAAGCEYLYQKTQTISRMTYAGVVTADLGVGLDLAHVSSQTTLTGSLQLTNFRNAAYCGTSNWNLNVPLNLEVSNSCHPFSPSSIAKILNRNDGNYLRPGFYLNEVVNPNIRPTQIDTRINKRQAISQPCQVGTAKGFLRYNGVSLSQACQIFECGSEAVLINNQCLPMTRSCSDSSGSGNQTWTGAAYGACRYTTCAAGRVLSNGSCIPSRISCYQNSGSGYQTWNGSSYGACVLDTCSPGWILNNNQCYYINPSYNVHLDCGGTPRRIIALPGFEKAHADSYCRWWTGKSNAYSTEYTVAEALLGNGYALTCETVNPAQSCPYSPYTCLTYPGTIVTPQRYLQNIVCAFY